MADFLAAALEYQQRGWLLIPKKPGTNVNYHGALTDTALRTADEVRAHWAAHSDDNIALLCGSASGVGIIDVDNHDYHNQGRKSAMRLRIPDTECHGTPRAGFHHVFEWRDGLKPGELAEFSGVEWLGENATALLPPSVVEAGAYQLIGDRPVVPLPEHIAAACVAVRSENGTGKKPVANAIAEGQRNVDLTRLAGKLRRSGLELAELEAALLTTNAVRCHPPLPESEVVAIAASVGKYEPGSDRPDVHTDFSMADRFAAEHRGRAVYVTQWAGWCVYQRGRWRTDSANLATAMAKKTVRALYRDAAAATDEETRKVIVRSAIQYEGAGKTRAMLEMSRAELPAEPEDFDVQPHLLNVANGTFDLEQGRLKPHDSADLLTAQARTKYDAAATAPRWDRFLLEVFDGDEAVVAYFTALVGSAVWADTTTAVFGLMHGAGSNGKSVLVETLVYVFGQYAAKISADTLLLAGAKDGAAATPDLARLRGVRLCFATEGSPGRRLNEPRIKELTGGDTIVARRLYEMPFEFKPCFRLFLSTNYLPSVQGTDHGIWRRVRLLPFMVRFEGANRDDNLADALRGEAAGILNWALAAAAAWKAHGLPEPPAAVLAATDTYRDDEDIVRNFLGDRCELATREDAPAGELYTAFAEWAGQGEGMSKTMFGRRLTEHGFEQFRDKQRRFWRGIRLRPEA